jgi:hypothetical protein
LPDTHFKLKRAKKMLEGLVADCSEIVGVREEKQFRLGNGDVKLNTKVIHHSTSSSH